MFTTLGARPAATDLVGLLLECHERIRHFLALAGELARRDDVPADEAIEVSRRTARYFREALPLHAADEDESLLPRLRARAPELDAELALMRDQHRQHQPAIADLLAALDEVAREGGGPGLAPARQRLGAATAALARELAEHLELEETRLFPAARRWLTADEQTRAIEELRARRRPA